MFRKVLCLTLLVLGLLACELQAGLVNSKWVGGERGEWGNKNNWDPSVVPDNNPFNAFAVTIDSNSIGVNGIEVYLEQDRTIDTLHCSGIIELHGPDGVTMKLTYPNGITNHGSLEVSGLTIAGNVTNLNAATLLLQDEVNIEDANLYNCSGAVLEGGVELEQGNIENAGVIVLKPGHDMWVDYKFRNTGQIRLIDGEPGSGGTFHNDGIISGFGKFCDDGQVIHNTGKIVASGGSLYIYDALITNTGILTNHVGATLHFEMPVTDVNNQGTVEINADGSIVFDCNLVNSSDPNAIISLRGGTLSAQSITQTEGARFEGFGGIVGDVIMGLVQKRLIWGNSSERVSTIAEHRE